MHYYESGRPLNYYCFMQSYIVRIGSVVQYEIALGTSILIITKLVSGVKYSLKSNIYRKTRKKIHFSAWKALHQLKV